jgi:serine/threonine-protein kinase
MQIDPEHWPLISRLLDEYLGLPVSARAGWLENLGREYAGLVPELRGLLSHSATDKHDLLNTLPSFRGTATGSPIPSALSAGALVGPYRLNRELGHGGMGVVWLAERADGLLKRPVALKLPLFSPHNTTLTRDSIASATFWPSSPIQESPASTTLV